MKEDTQYNGTQHKDRELLWLVSFMLSFTYKPPCAECRYAECHFAGCRGALLRGKWNLVKP
jgi:hypothetical protein